MVYQSVRAHWNANIALAYSEGLRAFWVPMTLTLLAVIAFCNLSYTAPKGKRLFTADLSLLKEFRAGRITSDVRIK